MAFISVTLTTTVDLHKYKYKYDLQVGGTQSKSQTWIGHLNSGDHIFCVLLGK
jgi:hypothetical protein